MAATGIHATHRRRHDTLNPSLRECGELTHRAPKMRIDALMEKPLDLPLLLRSIHDLLEEPDEERIGRITDPRFKTKLFNQTPISDSTDETAKGMHARKV